MSRYYIIQQDNPDLVDEFRTADDAKNFISNNEDFDVSDGETFYIVRIEKVIVINKNRKSLVVTAE